MTDQLAQLEEMLPTLGPALERRRIGESLGRTLAKLADADRLANRLRAVLQIAEEIRFGEEAQQGDELRDLVREARAFADDLQNAATPDDLTFICNNYPNFSKSVAIVDRQIRVHWRYVAERDFRPLVAIGDLLQRLGVASDLGRRLRKCGEEALENRDATPAEALLQSITRVRKTRSELDQERRSVTNDSEVDRFLTAIAEGNATLTLVTEGVRDWLARNRALDRFGVRAVS